MTNLNRAGVSIGLLLAAASAPTASAKELPKPLSYAKAVGDRHVFVMLGPADVDAAHDGADQLRALREKHPASGLYPAAGGDAVWTTDAPYVPSANAFPSTDGVHLALIEGDWWTTKEYVAPKRLSSETEQAQLAGPAVSLYAYGNLLKRYAVNDLITDPARFEHTPEHVLWAAGAAMNDDTGRFVVMTQDANQITFDLTTGEIESRKRVGLGNPITVWVVAAIGGLSVLILAVWAWLAFGRGRATTTAVAVAVAGVGIAPASRADELAPAPRAVAPAEAAIRLDRQLMDEVRERSELMANLRHLSYEIGPRLTGSANLKKANDWAAARMRAYGLENVRLEPWEIPVGWRRGPATARLVRPDNSVNLVIAAGGWTPGTDGPVTSPVVTLVARTKEDLATYRGKLRGAIVLLGEPKDVAPITDPSYGRIGPVSATVDPPKADPPKADPPKALPRPALTDLREFRREMADFLAGEGAVAQFADAGKPHGLLITTGGWRPGDRGTPQDPIPRVFVAHETYLMLHTLAEKYATAGGDPPRVELNLGCAFVPGPITVFNTVGEVRGTDKADEFVVLGAHLDSWDLATGTTDNGTGSTIVLEVARTLALLADRGVRPRRTVRFVLFSGEEQGLHGSKAYVKRHADEMPRVSAALVHDTGTGKVRGFGLQGRAAVLDVLGPELESLKALDGWDGLDLGALGGTDHQSFEAVGIPGFACRQDVDEYRLTHHTQSDTFDKAKGPNLVQGAQALAVAVMRIANLPELLPRAKPKKEDEGGPKSE